MLESRAAVKVKTCQVVIENIRKYSDTPIYTGFGVNEKTAKEKRGKVCTFKKVLPNFKPFPGAARQKAKLGN